MLRVVQFVLILLLVPAVTACVTPRGVQANSNDPALASPPIQLAQNTPPNSDKSTKSEPPEAGAMNGITRAVAKAGVKTCLDRIERTGNFLTENSKSKAIMYLPMADIDRQLTSASYEISYPNNTIAYASMTAAPTADGACDSLYETVVYWANSCTDLAEKGFPGTKVIGVVQEHIRVLQGKGNLRIFLMPAGPEGCVAIKKEVIY